MAGAAQHDWGFTEITRKFERQAKPARTSKERQRRWMAVPARGTVHVGVWLVVIAVLLMGLVTLRVGLLYKNIEFNDLIREKNSLRVQNDHLSSEVATLSSPERIEQIATGPLGMVPSGKVQYVYISPRDGQQYAELDLSQGPANRKTATP
jgi:cell division protein FtsL